MVMNKKGFLRIMEAIIAIVIILGFVIAILPTKPRETSRLPPDLKQTTNSFLKEMQNNPEFRESVLNGSVVKAREHINFLSSPAAAHPWNYGLKICKLDIDGIIVNCNYFPDVEGVILNERENNFRNNVLPNDRDIYTRTITLSSPDVSGMDPKVYVANPSVLTVYAWSK